MPKRKPQLKQVNVIVETCPVPLVETRKAVLSAAPGEVIEVIGDHPSSKKEIPMAVEEMGLELLSVEEKDEHWRIKIKVRKEGDESG